MNTHFEVKVTIRVTKSNGRMYLYWWAHDRPASIRPKLKYRHNVDIHRLLSHGKRNEEANAESNNALVNGLFNFFLNSIY